jgi:uncharacterized protein
MTKQGTPVWYELSTSDVNAAQGFYEKVLGWTIGDSGMEGFDYRIAKAGEEMVAGLMVPPMENVPPWWAIYFAVDDCDATAKAAEAAGGKIHVPPTDIPNVGRFAVLSDPQGAAFCILKGTGDGSAAFDQKKMGHGNWHELMSTDPKAGLAFYQKLFGWTPSQAMDMGAMGTYQIFAHQGQDIGGMMGLGNSPIPCWLPYFGADGIDAALGRIKANGGSDVAGPMEVPGGAFIVVARDPQGAFFALVGPK